MARISGELSAKLATIRAALASAGAAAVRLRGVDWFAWATCGGSNVVILTTEAGIAEVLVTADIGAEMYETLGRVAPVIEIPEAGHHAMLDQPLLLLTALRTLVADWEHSEPHRRPD